MDMSESERERVCAVQNLQTSRLLCKHDARPGSGTDAQQHPLQWAKSSCVQANDMCISDEVYNSRRRARLAAAILLNNPHSRASYCFTL